MAKVIILAHHTPAALPRLAAELVRRVEVCKGDGKPCYVSADTDDAHWRCGTGQCGDDYLSGRDPRSKAEPAASASGSEPANAEAQPSREEET